jgi:hypothetical protein
LNQSNQEYDSHSEVDALPLSLRKGNWEHRVEEERDATHDPCAILAITGVIQPLNPQRGDDNE